MIWIVFAVLSLAVLFILFIWITSWDIERSKKWWIGQIFLLACAGGIGGPIIFNIAEAKLTDSDAPAPSYQEQEAVTRVEDLVDLMMHYVNQRQVHLRTGIKVANLKARVDSLEARLKRLEEEAGR